MNYAETKEWVTALDRLDKMPLKTIVPGHGPVCTEEAARPLADYIRSMRQQVKKALRAAKASQRPRRP